MNIEDYNRSLIKDLLPKLGFDYSNRLYVCDVSIIVHFDICYVQIIVTDSINTKINYVRNVNINLISENIVSTFKEELTKILNSEIKILQSKINMIQDKINSL